MTIQPQFDLPPFGHISTIPRQTIVAQRTSITSHNEQRKQHLIPDARRLFDISFCSVTRFLSTLGISSSTPFTPSSSKQRSSSLPSTLNWHTPSPQFASRAPYIPCFAPNLRQGATIPLSHPIPLSHSFINTISWPWTRLSSMGHHTRPSISPAPFRSLSTVQRRPSKAQPRCFGPSHISSPTPLPSQQRSSFGLQLTYPTSYTFQSC